MDPTVFVVIPVFNRLKFTLSCLGCLRAQTYPALRIIVVDGGSTDGTVATLRCEHPEVEVLEGERELWWAGAMHLGIERVLAESRNDADMLLMMNNDTSIEPSYVETLVRVSRETGAAVGGLIVDSHDPSRVLDAGEFIDWQTYSFPVKTSVKPGETLCDRVDVLPGRGSLVPLRMIRVSGNLDCKAFPHYIADYEFFARLRRHGFPLVVTYEARIAAHIEETGIMPTRRSLTLRQAWDILFSRKSMQNVRDHLRFIERCAPPEAVASLKFRFLWVSLEMVLFDTKLKYGVSWLKEVWFVLRSIYYVSDGDCERCRLNAAVLTKEGILHPWLREGWYMFAVRRQEWWSSRPELRRLYLRAWNPLTKRARWRAARQHLGSTAEPRSKVGPVTQ